MAEGRDDEPADLPGDEQGEEQGDDPQGDAVEPSHDDDGLDLARRAARAAAGAGTPLPRRRRAPRRTGGGPVPGRGTDDRDPQLLGGALSRLVADHGWSLDLRVRGVFGRWPELVGAEVAQHCTPESFADGRLVVRTDSTAWATQLRLLAPQLVTRLNEELGAGTVVALDVQGPHAPSWRKGPRSTRDGRGPRDTYG